MLCRVHRQPSTRLSIKKNADGGVDLAALPFLASPNRIRFRRGRSLLSTPKTHTERLLKHNPESIFRAPHRQADDDLADSLRKHPTPIPTTGTGQVTATGAEGAYDFFEEPVEKDEYAPSAGIGDKESDRTSGGSSSHPKGSDDYARSDPLPPLRPVPTTPSSSSGASFRPGEEGVSRKSGHTGSNFLLHMRSNSSHSGGDPDHHGSSRLRPSLGWELAHLLHVCLGRYLEPGGPSPGVSLRVLCLTA